MSLPNTGERFLPSTGGISKLEHFHRYLLTAEVVHGLDVLDVASGEGYGSHILARSARSVVGVDLSPAAVSSAQQSYSKPNLRFVEGDCTKLPLPDATFDMVVSFETIEHHNQHEAMLQEIRRVLRPDGVLLISSPNRPEYNRALKEPNPYHVKELDYQEFIDLLAIIFPEISVYGQYQLGESAGSLVLPFKPDRSVAHEVDVALSASPHGLNQPVYFIALAGNALLPDLRSSFYEQEVSASTGPERLDILFYFSERIGGKTTGYSQTRSLGEGYLLDGNRKTVSLTVPQDVQALASLRLDIASAPCGVVLHRFAVLSQQGVELWSMEQQGCELFAKTSGLLCFAGEAGLVMLCLDNDPQAEVLIPKEVLDQVQGSDRLVLEFTPRPLLETLSSLSSDVLGRGSEALGGSALTNLKLGLVDQLTQVAALLKSGLEDKNRRIAEQQAELETLHTRQELLNEQIVRAEAQLELLKEIVGLDLQERL